MLSSHLSIPRYVNKVPSNVSWESELIDIRDYPLVGLCFTIENDSNSLNGNVIIYGVFNKSFSITDVDPVQVEIQKFAVTNSQFPNTTQFNLVEFTTACPYLKVNFEYVSGGNATEYVNVIANLKTYS